MDSVIPREGSQISPEPRQWAPIAWRTNLWLVPTLCVLAALALFVFSQSLDRAAYDHRITLPHWIDQGSASDARDLLSATVGAIITTLGLVLSITVLTLSIAATQFGQRLLRRFMRDRGTQICIGIFSATFVFSLLTLLSVTSRPQERQFVPWFSCWVSTMLALSCIATLIFYVNHVAQTIQVNTILADISADLRRIVHEQAAQDGTSFSLPQIKQDFFLKAPASGYLRKVDFPALARAAEKCDAVVQFLGRPGQFVIAGMALAAGGRRRGRSGAPDAPAQLVHAFARALDIGPRRTMTQDPEFAFAQIVEIGLRAMSPAVNDPNTMFTCVQWLGDGLRVIAQTLPHRTTHADGNGEPRVIELEYPYHRFVGAAFDPLRQVARDSPEASVVMLETIAALAGCLTEEKHLAPLAAQAELVREGFNKDAPSHDRARVDAAYQRAIGATRRGKAA
ncbi:MAG TPA: DUF2254 domain-containing protein [Candidatus Angelobacter sp.]